MSNSVELPTDYSSFIHRSRYARWIPELGRRETWGETVQRYMDFMLDHLKTNGGYEPDVGLVKEIHHAILRRGVMPSMRAFMSAGPALAKENVAAFNCSYTPIDHPRAFDEILYILMNGTGVGFSCERQEIAKLPPIPDELYPCDIEIKVGDSKMKWAQAYKQLLALLWVGQLPTWDLSRVRPAGARLKTFGGRASGPEPLDRLFKHTVRLFQSAKGRQLESIEVHDLVCFIADVVVVGGTRRSALISLSNLSDQRMRDAKSGNWYEQYGHRRLANNSVAYDGRPEIGHFMEEWTALYKSYSGERGVFNRAAARAKCEEIGRDPDWNFATNPCGEIILRPNGFCNLTEVVARADDTVQSIARKVELATILGTWQSTLTNFRYLRKKWRDNAEEERLLGVSFTGIMDCPVLHEMEIPDFAVPTLEERLAYFRTLARDTNRAEAEKIGISPSAAISCVKPSGTVSQLVDASSGIHQRFSPMYIRRVRNDVKDPLTDFLIEQGVPHEVDKFNPGNVVFEFPVEGPSETDTKKRTAIEQLEFWLIYRRHWCDHNPSTTIYVEEHEWMQVGAWVFEHFDEIGGLSFLPLDGGVYEQAPYEAVDRETLDALKAAMPDSIDWTQMREDDDNTEGSQELACTGGACEWSGSGT